MRITCSTSTLAKALSTNILPLIPNRTPKEILKNVLIRTEGKTLKLFGTNLDQSAWDVIGAEIHEPGSISVPADHLLRIVKETDSPTIDIEDRKDGVRITLRNGSFRMPTGDPFGFPEPENVPDWDNPSFVVDAGALRTGITRTVFCCGESSRYALAALCMDIQDGLVRFVATDGKRLAVSEVAAMNTQPTGSFFLLPSESANQIRRMFDADSPVEVYMSHNDAWFRQQVMDERTEQIYKTLLYHTRLSEGRFPQYMDMFARVKPDNIVKVTAGSLRSVLRQAIISTDEMSKGIVFAFGTDGLTMSAKSERYGDSSLTLDCVKVDEPFKVTFDGHLIDSIFKNGVNDDTPLTWKLNSDGKLPSLLSTDDKSDFLLMPLTAVKPKTAKKEEQVAVGAA